MTKPTIAHRTWLYGPGNEPRCFEPGDEHPGHGWSDTPDPAVQAPSPVGTGEPAATADTPSVAELLAEREAGMAFIEDLRAELIKANEALAAVTAERDQLATDKAALEAQVAAFDHDGDGKAGGSKKSTKTAEKPAE